MARGGEKVSHVTSRDRRSRRRQRRRSQRRQRRGAGEQLAAVEARGAIAATHASVRVVRCSTSSQSTS